MHHLCPDEGVEASALGADVIGMVLLVPQVKEGTVPVDDVVGKPRRGGEASEGAYIDCGMMAGIDAVWVGGWLAPVALDQHQGAPCQRLEDVRRCDALSGCGPGKVC